MSPLMRVVNYALHHLGLSSEYAAEETQTNGTVECTYTRNGSLYWAGRVKVSEQ